MQREATRRAWLDLERVKSWPKMTAGIDFEEKCMRGDLSYHKSAKNRAFVSASRLCMAMKNWPEVAHGIVGDGGASVAMLERRLIVFARNRPAPAARACDDENGGHQAL